MGTSAWADEVVGSITDGYLANKSTSITVEDGGSIHYVFSQVTAGASNAQGFVLVAKASESGDPLVALRGDNFENVAWSNAGCSNNYDWTNFPALMNGASFDMTVTYANGLLSMSADVTGSDSNPYTYSYKGVVKGAPSSVVVYLSEEAAQLTITESTYTPATAHYNTVRYNQDYENAGTYATGWTTSRDAWKQGNLNGGKVFLVEPSNATTYTLSFADNDYFKNSTDFMFSFEYLFSVGNGNAGASSLVVKDKSGNNLFSITNAGNYANGCNITFGETTRTNVLFYPYNDTTAPFTTFILTGNATEGLKLSVGGQTWMVTYNKGKNTERCGTVAPFTEVRIGDFANIGSIVLTAARGASHYAIDNMIFREHTEGAIAEDPTFALKSVSGENRVYTITNPNGEGTLYYTTETANDAPAVGDVAYSSTTNSSIDVPLETGTYYAYAVLADGTTTSAVVSQAVTGGAITLNTPTWTKTAYNAGTATSTVTLSSDQSNKLMSPVATIYYTINGGAATEYTSPISVVDGETLAYYATASGYTNSAEGSVVAVAPCSYGNICSETYNGVVAVNNNLTIEDGSDYRHFYYNSGSNLVSTVLLTKTVTFTSGSNTFNHMLRANGIYAAGGWTFAINDLKDGDYVTINGAYGNAAFEINNPTNMSKDTWNSISGSKYCYTVTADGQVTFTLARYGYIQSITIQRETSSVSVSVSDAGYATYVNSDYDLNFSATDIEAYKVKVSTKGIATLTKVDNVPAGTPVLLYKAGGATEDIPVMTGAAAVTGNDLVAGTGAAVATTDDGYTNMILNNGSKGIGFYFAAGKTVAANRAYLHIATTLAPDAVGAGSRMSMVFDGETTGVDAALVNSEKVNSEVYDLQGRRVAQPTKGLYIVNGKKVIIK